MLKLAELSRDEEPWLSVAERGPKLEDLYEEFEELVLPVLKYRLWSLLGLKASVGCRCGDGDTARSGNFGDRFSSWIAIFRYLSRSVAVVVVVCCAAASGVLSCEVEVWTRIDTEDGGTDLLN